MSSRTALLRRMPGLTLIVLATLLRASIATTADPPPRFALHHATLTPLTTPPPSEHPIPDPKHFLSRIDQKNFLSRATKQGDPILTESDIETYCWQSQTLHLTPAGAARWDSLGCRRVPLGGIPLLVEVDGEPRYGALLWNPVSSLSARLPQFWCLSPEGRLHLGGPLISAQGDTLYRENYDPAVRELMRELGKLSPDCQ